MVSWIPYKDKILNVQTDKKDFGGANNHTFRINTFQKSWDGGNKRAQKCSKCSKTPDWNIPQVIRSIADKCVMKPGF